MTCGRLAIGLLRLIYADKPFGGLMAIMEIAAPAVAVRSPVVVHFTHRANDNRPCLHRHNSLDRRFSQSVASWPDPFRCDGLEVGDHAVCEECGVRGYVRWQVDLAPAGAVALIGEVALAGYV
jgi:hypothetical protein